MNAGLAAERFDRIARNSRLLEWSVRVSLVAYAFVHLVVGVVAVRLVLVGGAGRATGRGALEEVAQDAFGRLVLAAMAVGFAVLVVWQLIAGLVGYRNLAGWWRAAMRLSAAGRVFVYGYLAVAAGQLALQGAPDPGSGHESLTARLMAVPAGRLLVGATGIGTAAIGVGLAIFGARRGFMGQLDERVRTSDRRLPIVVVGQVGYVVKGVAFVLIGMLLVWTAFLSGPARTGGLDRSLYLLLGQTLGGPAVVIAGLGIASFGLYVLARSRHLDQDSITS